MNRASYNAKIRAREIYNSAIKIGKIKTAELFGITLTNLHAIMARSGLRLPKELSKHQNQEQTKE